MATLGGVIVTVADSSKVGDGDLQWRNPGRPSENRALMTTVLGRRRCGSVPLGLSRPQVKWLTTDALETIRRAYNARHVEHFLGMVRLGCMQILIRHL